MLASAGIAFSVPHVAGAFWPFSVAKGDTVAKPVLHDASLNLLAAPLSENVDDTIDTGTANQLLTTLDGSALIPGGALDSSTTPSDSTDTLTFPTNGSISTYTVQAGDNLSTIAQNYGVTVNTILWANNIKDSSTIKQGTKLVILPVSGIEHTVRSGETLSSVATKFGADANDIAQFNGLPADGALIAGSTIIIPGGELPSTSSASSSSSAPKKTTTGTKAGSVTKSSSAGSSSLSCDMSSGNPCHGISGPVLHGFFTNPLPQGAISQGLHGWDAVDISAHSGTPIVAAADGSVILSRTGGWNGGYGNYVIIDNGSGVETLYSHMSQMKAEAGESVSAGEVIGYVGETGDATGYHLHFEVRGAQNPFASCSVGKSSSSCL